MFELTSTAFQEGNRIPEPYTGDGEDRSPPLKWTDPPEGTETLALICEDPDAPQRPFTHWVVVNIPGMGRELPEGIPQVGERPNGLLQGTNDFDSVGYRGPAPPAGETHRYVFTLYALNTRLRLEPGLRKQDLINAMAGYILKQTQLTGTYSREATS